jgi:glutamate formiminotransferase
LASEIFDLELSTGERVIIGVIDVTPLIPSFAYILTLPRKVTAQIQLKLSIKIANLDTYTVGNLGNHIYLQEKDQP